MKVKRRKFAVMNSKVVNQFELILFRLSLFLVFLTVLLPNNGVCGYYEGITLDFEKKPQVTRTLKSPQDALYIEVDNSNARPGVEYQVSILIQNLKNFSVAGNSDGNGGVVWVKMKGYSRAGGEKYFETNLAILSSGPDPDPVPAPVPAPVPVQYFGWSVNVWAYGNWGPSDEARVIATIFYERQSCSDCPQTLSCCPIHSKCDGTGNGNENTDTDREIRRSQNAQKITREFNIETIQFRKLMEGRNGSEAVAPESEDVLTIILDSDSDSDFNSNGNGKNVENSESSQNSKFDHIMEKLGYWNSGFGIHDSKKEKEVVNNARCFPWGYNTVCEDGSGSGSGSDGNCSENCSGDGNGTSGDCGCGTYWEANCMNNSIVATILLTVFFFLLTPVVLSFLLCYHRQMGLFSFRQSPPPPPPTVSSPVDDLPPTYEEIEEPPPCFCSATSTMNLYKLDETGTGGGTGIETGTSVIGNRPVSLFMVDNLLEGGVLNPGFAPYFPPPTPPTPTSLNIPIPCSCGRGGLLESEDMGRDSSNSKWLRFSLSARNLMSRVSPSRFILPGRIRTVSHGRIRGSTSSQTNIIMHSHNNSDLDNRPSPSGNGNSGPPIIRPTGSPGSIVGFNSDNYSNYIV